MDTKLTRAQLAWLSLAGLAIFLCVWSLPVALGLVQRRFLPLPWGVAATLVDLLHHPFAGATLQGHLLSSINRYVRGFLLAACVGVPLGLLMGWYRWVDNIVSPLFNALRFIAPIAWVPFAALWFGTGIGGPTMIIFAGAFPPCLINAHRGARQVERRYIEVSQVFGASGFRVIVEVLLPSSFAAIVAGLRVGAGTGWQSLVAAELVAANTGIGLMMVRGQAALDARIVMAGMVAVGIVGLLLDVALQAVEKYTQRRMGARS